MMGPERTTGMTPWVRRILVATLLVYLLQLTVVTDLTLLGPLVFDPFTALTRPWTFVTYLFLHASLLHLAFNLLALFIFGPAVEARLGSRTFLFYYLGCGFGGAALSVALMLILPARPMVGASAAVYGVMLAYAWLWPNEGIFVFPFPEPIPAKWLVTLLVAVSLVLALFPASDGVAHLAHLGGLATGFVFLQVRAWRAGAEPPPSLTVERVLVHPGPRAARASEPEPRKQAPAGGRDLTQSEIDRVLDKISATGLESLTPAERRFLAEMSRKLRQEP